MELDVLAASVNDPFRPGRVENGPQGAEIGQSQGVDEIDRPTAAYLKQTERTPAARGLEFRVQVESVGAFERADRR